MCRMKSIYNAAAANAGRAAIAKITPAACASMPLEAEFPESPPALALALSVSLADASVPVALSDSVVESVVEADPSVLDVIEVSVMEAVPEPVFVAEA